MTCSQLRSPIFFSSPTTQNSRPGLSQTGILMHPLQSGRMKCVNLSTRRLLRQLETLSEQSTRSFGGVSLMEWKTPRFTAASLTRPISPQSAMKCVQNRLRVSERSMMSSSWNIAVKMAMTTTLSLTASLTGSKSNLSPSLFTTTATTLSVERSLIATTKLLILV